MTDVTGNEAPDRPKKNGSSEITGPEVRSRIVELAFDGSERRFGEFMSALREAIPRDVSVILRGSAVTGHRWADGQPFDADGPGTSDLDLTLIGGRMLDLFDDFYIPGLHSVPLSDEHPEASAVFTPLRRALSSLARRPVNIQATTDLVQYARDVLFDQPYYTLLEKIEQEDMPSGKWERRHHSRDADDSP